MTENKAIKELVKKAAIKRLERELAQLEAELAALKAKPRKKRGK